MSILLGHCKQCKKDFGFNPSKCCNICKIPFQKDICIQCHNIENHRFIPLRYRYGIRTSASVFSIQVITFGLLTYAFMLTVVNL